MLKPPLVLVAVLMTFVASSALAHPDPKHSLQAIDADISAFPNDPQLHLTKAGILLGIGHVDDAIRSVDAAARLDEKARNLGYYEARIMQALHHEEQARARLKTFVQAEPQHADAWRLLASLAMKAGQTDEAIVAAQSLLKLDDVLPDDFTQAAAMYLHRAGPGDDDSALQVLNLGLAKLGCLTGLHRMAMDIEVRLHRHDAALARLTQLTQRLGPHVEYETQRADILVAAGRSAEAAQACDNAIAIMDTFARERQATAAFVSARAHLIEKRDALRKQASGK